MKHHDSIKQAEVKMSRTLAKLAKWRLPATPINYAIGYEYVGEKNSLLIAKVDQHIQLHHYLDNYIIESLYQQFVLRQNEFRDEMFDDVVKITSEVKNICLKSTVQSQQFVESIDKSLSHFNAKDENHFLQTVSKLKQSSLRFREDQQKLAKALFASEQQATLLAQELVEAQKEIYLDPITRLYNKKALNKHFEAWVTEDPNKQIAAVVVNVDHFKAFNDKFGSLISDVILSKVANKVSNYVGESGLPVRTGHDEFLILLPDIEVSVANEIAEKIRQGVEKTRFISSKSGIRLPQMTISLGVSELTQCENLSAWLKRTKRALFSAQEKGYNQVALA